MGRSNKKRQNDKISRSDERKHANRDERRAIRQILVEVERGENIENFATEKKLRSLSMEWED